MNHSALHTSPSTPITAKANRQLPCRMHQTTSGGATSAPTDEPMLNQPVAIERSLAGNHSDVARKADGKPAASVTPSMARNTASDTQLPAVLCRMQTTDQAPANSAKPSLVPSTSST